MSKIIFNFGNKTIEKDMNDIKSEKDVKNAFSEVMKKENIMQKVRDESYLIKMFDDFRLGYINKFEVYPYALKLIKQKRITLKRVKEIAYLTCKIPPNVVDDRIKYMKILDNQL